MFDIDRDNRSNVKLILKFILVLMLFILGPFFFSTAAIAETSQTGSISGQVVDEFGNPISNATVIAYLFDDTQIIKSGWTDTNGNYSINNLNSGDYIVKIYAGGWISQQRAEYVTVTAPDDTSQINFTLRFGGSISGTVLDEQGNPITIARVCAIPVNSIMSGRIYYVVNANGNYNIIGLDSGDYIIEVQAESWIIQQRTEHVTAPDNTGNINFTLKKGGSITGRVLDEQGQPIVNAKVYVSTTTKPSYSFYRTTDDTGNYVINSLSSGTYAVYVNAAGWVSEKQIIKVEVVAPNDTSNINFTLQRGGSISGKVVDESGNPISNAMVTAYIIEDENLFISSNFGETDTQGNYIIRDLINGKYRIKVKASGWADQEYSTYVIVNSPDDTSQINFTLHPGGSISGTVSDEQGNPIVNADVNALPVNDNSLWYYSHTDANGKYFITGLESGDYIVYAQSNGWIQQQKEDPVNVTVPQKVENINFTLKKGASISGQVLDDHGQPVVQASVYLTLIQTPSYRYSGSITDDNGNYVIQSIPSGSYEVQVSADGWIFQRYFHSVEVVAPSDISNINFTMQRGGRVSGHVLNEQGQPIVKANVYIFSTQIPSNYYSSTTDDTGNYTIQSLPSGKYEVNVSANGWIRQKYSDWVEVLAPNDTGNINFTMPRGGSISGQVLDEQGQPIVKANVYIFSKQIPYDSYSGTTDDTGNYVIQSLPSGSYGINVNANGWIRHTYSNRVEVLAPNDTNNINFTMLRGGSISGRVVDNNGKPINYATVYVSGMGGGPSPYICNSDKIGYYKCEGLPEGNYQVEVQAKGWKRQTYAGNVNVEDIIDSGGINFSLYPTTPISDLSAIPGDGNVKLTFSHPTGASIIIVIYKEGYGIYQQAVTDPLHENSESVTISGLTNGTRYTFELFVADGVYEGESNEVTVTPTGEIDECFIATAAFGSKFEPAVVLLREFRDQFLLTNYLGEKFVQFYYRASPPIAHYIADNMILKYLVRALLIQMVGMVYILFHPSYGFVLIVTWILIISVRKMRWV